MAGWLRDFWDLVTCRRTQSKVHRETFNLLAGDILQLTLHCNGCSMCSGLSAPVVKITPDHHVALTLVYPPISTYYVPDPDLNPNVDARTGKRVGRYHG